MQRAEQRRIKHDAPCIHRGEAERGSPYTPPDRAVDMCRSCIENILEHGKGKIQEIFSRGCSRVRRDPASPHRSNRSRRPWYPASKPMPGREKTRPHASLAFRNEPVGALREAPVPPARAVLERPLQAYTSFALDRHSGACRNDGQNPKPGGGAGSRLENQPPLPPLVRGVRKIKNPLSPARAHRLFMPP